jgi:hypothetical protein
MGGRGRKWHGQRLEHNRQHKSACYDEEPFSRQGHAPSASDKSQRSTHRIQGRTVAPDFLSLVHPHMGPARQIHPTWNEGGGVPGCTAKHGMHCNVQLLLAVLVPTMGRHA